MASMGKNKAGQQKVSNLPLVRLPGHVAATKVRAHGDRAYALS